jgi:hypothetical protein
VISGECNTYKLLSCPDGDCFCGQDIQNQPTCFEDEFCWHLKACSSNLQCGLGEACGVKDCCNDGSGRCLKTLTGCIDSPPATKTPYWEPFGAAGACKRSRKRQGFTVNKISTLRKRLVC